MNLKVEEYLVGETDEFPDDIDEDSICRSEEVCAGLEYLASKLRSDLECRPLTCFSDFETIVENSVGYAGEGGGGKGDGVDLEASFNWHYMLRGGNSSPGPNMCVRLLPPSLSIL